MAGVGRATYYAHYSSKHELLRSQFSRIVAPMLREQQEDPCPLDCTLLFAHVRTTPRLYKALMRGPEGGAGARILRTCFEERIRRVLAVGAANPIAPKFVAASLLAIIEFWIGNGLREPPEALQAVFRKLVGGGLGAYLSLKSEDP